MQASVQITGMEVFKELRDLGKQGPTACARALSRSAQKGKGVVVQEVAARYQIAPEKVMKTLKKSDASAQKLWASITSKSRAIPLYEFGGLPTEPFKGGTRPKGASVNVLGSGKFVHQKPAHPMHYAFVAQMQSGHVGIFARTGEYGRVPLQIKAPKSQGGGWLFNIKKPGGKGLERIAEMYMLPVPKMIEQVNVFGRICTGINNLLQEETAKEYNKEVKKIFKEWASK